MSDEMYLICKTTRSVGDNAMFWRPNNQGYTDNLAEAGLYSHGQAKDICLQNPQNVAYPVDGLYNSGQVKRVVDLYKLKQIEIEGQIKII